MKKINIKKKGVIFALVALSIVFFNNKAKYCSAEEIIIGAQQVEEAEEKLEKEFSPIVFRLYQHNWEGRGRFYFIGKSRYFTVCKKSPGILGPCYKGKLLAAQMNELLAITNKKAVSCWKNEYKPLKHPSRMETKK